MCGIAAIFAYGDSAAPVDRDEVRAIRDHMAARGPDGVGEWFSDDGRLGLGHRRLSIIDLSPAGAQPMLSADGSLAIIFNGEIYNYRELRLALEQKGRKFQSQSDTEVLLHLYAEHGDAMLAHVRGMYAFAIWNLRKRCLFAARDPFGIKPLYYNNDGATLRVASQVKALLRSKQVDTDPDPAGHVGFFVWGSVPEPYTLYRGIRALPAGHTLFISENGRVDVRPFCSVQDLLNSSDAEKSRSISREELRGAIDDTVEHHLVADVPVGVFLSSGLDSTTLAAFASSRHSNLKTVTLGFNEYRGTPEDEVPFAEETAQRLGTEHRTIWVSRENFEAESEKLLDAMDQPSIDGVNTYFVSLAAKRAGLKVALSGLGGDEVFGGYEGFRQIPRAARLLKPFGVIPAVGTLIRKMAAPWLGGRTSTKYAGLFEYGSTLGGAYFLRRGLFMPWELSRILPPETVREGWEELDTLGTLQSTVTGLRSSDRGKISALEMSFYMRNQLLRDADWAGMAHSVEIRVPFVDAILLRKLAPFIASATPPSKRDMAKSAPSDLPAALLERPKTGFVVPVREWLRGGASASEVPPSLGYGAAGSGPATAGKLRSEVSNFAERGLRGWAREVYAREREQGAGSRERGAAMADREQRTEVSGHLSELAGQNAQVTSHQSQVSNQISAFQDVSVSDFEKLPAPASKLQAAKRVLVFRIGQLGDTIVALPAMRAIRDHFPDAHIELLCDRHEQSNHMLAADVLAPTGLFDGFITYNVGHPNLNKGSQFSELAAVLRSKQFDTVVYLAPLKRNKRQIWRDWLFFRSVGIRHFLGFRNFQRVPSKRSGEPLPEMASEGNLLLERLAVDGIKLLGPQEQSFDFSLTGQDEDRFTRWLSTCRSYQGRRWIAVGPGSKMPAKRWPVERFEQVVTALIDEFDIWPVVFGGAEDERVGDELLEKWNRGCNAAGALGIRPALVAMQRCALFLGNDTGTMHMAAAVGLRCVAIFSSREHRGLWYPQGEGHRVFRSAIECEGCELIECMVLGNECLKRISADEVREACRDILTNKKFGARDAQPISKVAESNFSSTF